MAEIISDIELKPCPFCGVVPRMKLYTSMSGTKFYDVSCENAECRICLMTIGTMRKEEAAAIWNRRAINCLEDDLK